MVVPARHHVALVLAGGAALGAYEVGAVCHLLESLDDAAELDILSGTSAGALNVSFLAAHADAPRERGPRLAELWTSLRLGTVLRPSGIEILGMLLDGRADCLPGRLRTLRGGVLDRRRFELLFRRATPMERIGEHLRAGRLEALTLSTTQIATGRCTSFVQARASIAAWDADPMMTYVAGPLTHQHALASAAIPLLFPAVVIDGEAYCDGGLRQVVPLSPALHLGARSIVVVNPLIAPMPDARTRLARLAAMTSPVYLAGKALNALLLDRMEVDLARLDQVNSLLAAGTRRWGPGFTDALNLELARAGAPQVRPVRTWCLQPSRDIGRLAAEYVASREFARREPGLAGQCLRLLGHGDPERAGDLLSYLLFDGEFAARLIELGRADARARQAELSAFFADARAAA